MNNHIKRFILTAAVIACLSAASSARAIDRYKFIPLRHLGFGGVANGASFKPGTDVDSTFGQVRDAAGNSHACVWRQSQGTWVLHVLPGMLGPNSYANAIVIDFTGAGIIVGGAETTARVMKPVSWTENADGSFTSHTLPPVDGLYGIARGIFAGEYGDGRFAGIVGTSQAGGQEHATFWRVTSGGIVTVDLGTLGGDASDATAITTWDPNCPSGCTIEVVGRARTPSGAWHACSWILDPADPINFGIVDRHPGGVSSWFEDTCGHGDHIACGTALAANGRSIAIKSGLNTLDGFATLPFPNANNTAADAIDCTRYGSLVAGSAWNDPTMPRAVVWNTIVGLGTSAYPIGIMIDGGSGNDRFELKSIGPGIITGSFFDVALEVPIILLRDGVQLPDVVNVTMGIPENNFSETDLWHAGDGNTLRIRTRNTEGDRASLEVSYFLAETQDGSGTDNANIRARTIGSPGSSADMEVEVFSFDTGMWDFVGMQVFGDDGAWAYSATSFSAGGHCSVNGEVRLRLNFMPLRGNLRGVEVDSVMLDIPPTLGL